MRWLTEGLATAYEAATIGHVFVPAVGRKDWRIPLGTLKSDDDEIQIADLDGEPYRAAEFWRSTTPVVRLGLAEGATQVLRALPTAATMGRRLELAVIDAALMSVSRTRLVDEYQTAVFRRGVSLQDSLAPEGYEENGFRTIFLPNRADELWPGRFLFEHAEFYLPTENDSDTVLALKSRLRQGLPPLTANCMRLVSEFECQWRIAWEPARESAGAGFDGGDALRIFYRHSWQVDWQVFEPGRTHTDHFVDADGHDYYFVSPDFSDRSVFLDICVMSRSLREELFYGWQLAVGIE